MPGQVCTRAVFWLRPGVQTVCRSDVISPDHWDTQDSFLFQESDHKQTGSSSLVHRDLISDLWLLRLISCMKTSFNVYTSLRYLKWFPCSLFDSTEPVCGSAVKDSLLDFVSPANTNIDAHTSVTQSGSLSLCSQTGHPSLNELFIFYQETMNES